jgi:methylmalonyl-CoA epimerase
MASAVGAYERLFDAVREHHETVPEQGVEAVSLRVGEGRIELLRPLGEDTPVGRFIASRGPGMHHVAFGVSDIERALRDAHDAGAELIDEEPHPGLFGLQVAFIHPSSVAGVLVEYVQVEGAADG